MGGYPCEVHTFATVRHEDVVEEVFQLWCDIFGFIRLRQYIPQLEPPITLPLNIKHQIMPLKRIIGKQHKIEQYAQRPYIHTPRIGQILQYLRRHILLRSTHRTGRTRFHRPSKPKIRYFIDPPTFFCGFDQHILGFDIPVDVVFLVDYPKALHDLNDDL